jgi:hypothetical protein
MSELPICAADITPAWLNGVLAPDVRGGATVTAVDAVVIGDGVGFLGEVARLHLQYDAPSASSTHTLISKIPTTNEGFKTIGNTFGLYLKEHRFYAHIADRITIDVPIAYVNACDHDAEHYVLVLQDMAPRRSGNQLAGCSREEAEVALRSIASFHATWWNHPQLEDFRDWLPAAGDPFFDATRDALAPGLDRLEASFAHWVQPEVIAIGRRLLGQFDEILDGTLGREPTTFLHGDFRLDNMMFDTTADGIAFTLLDWQLPFRGNPMNDVVYFLVGNLDVGLRRAREDELLHVYHDELVRCGASDYTFAQCHDDYRFCGLTLMSYLAAIARDVDVSTLNERGTEMIEIFMTRYAQGMLDLRSADFLT